MVRRASFKAVLFDLDGTLIEFKFKVKESRQAMIQRLKQMGFDTAKLSAETKTQSLMDEAGIQLRNSSHLSNSFTFDGVMAELSTILDRFEMQAFKEAKSHPGSLAVLRDITAENVLTGIVTNSGRVPVDSLLGTFGFLPYVSLVITRNEMKRLKPHPDGILQALERLSTRREDALYVGDSVIDIQAAKEANVKCAGVATGLYGAEQLMSFDPDFLIHRIEDLENIVFS